MTRHGISINVLRETKDHSSLESHTAKSAAINQALSGNSNAADLPELGSTVRHLLIHHVGNLESQLPHQVVVQVGGARCRDVGRLQHREGPSLHNQNVF